MSDKEQYLSEHRRRISRLASRAEAEKTKPNLIVRDEILKSLQAKNPLIQPQRPFVGMGHDGFSDEWFPT